MSWRAVARSKARRFNPCCSGSGSSTRGMRGGLRGSSMFQSLLQWIGLINFASDLHRIRRKVFQSLLQWIGLINRRYPPTPIPRVCSFNPCCSGSGSSTLEEGMDYVLTQMFQSLLQWIGLINTFSGAASGSITGVSILVAVDRAHQHG